MWGKVSNGRRPRSPETRFRYSKVPFSLSILKRLSCDPSGGKNKECVCVWGGGLTWCISASAANWRIIPGTRFVCAAATRSLPSGLHRQLLKQPHFCFCLFIYLFSLDDDYLFGIFLVSDTCSSFFFPPSSSLFAQSVWISETNGRNSPIAKKR